MGGEVLGEHSLPGGALVGAFTVGGGRSWESVHTLTCCDAHTVVFHSYGNIPAGNAMLYKFPLSAFTGSTPPTVSDATWTYSNSGYVSVKAAHFLPSGRVAALITSDDVAALMVIDGSTNAVIWGP